VKAGIPAHRLDSPSRGTKADLSLCLDRIMPVLVMPLQTITPSGKRSRKKATCDMSMLTLSSWLLGAAILGGVALIGLLQWARPTGRIWTPGALHGLLGLAGLAALTLGLREPTRATQSGAGQFGIIAAVLLACAVLCGAVMFLARATARKPPGLMLGLHATFAVGGVIMLVAYISEP
jgi:hypothetical protein